jgi:ubiquinone/menaquinone biosynthesis C-methylase UbiE
MNQQKDLWESLAKKNFRYYVNSDLGRGITEEEFRESGVNDYMRFLENDPLIQLDSTLLEIGCGAGRMTEFIALDWPKVIATDISGEMIKQGKERLKNFHNITWIETDGYTFPIESNSVDVAFSYIVFPHMKTREMVEKNFNEVHRILRMKGLFKVEMRADKHDNLGQWWGGVRWTEETIRELCYRIQFKVLKIEKVQHCAFWVWLEK